MASSNPLSAIPRGVAHPLRLAPGLGESSDSNKKRKRAPNNVIGLRYNFKPGSITAETPGAVHTVNGSKTLKFDLATGGQQVFDAREEQGKSRECVMIWDDESQTFTLHPLSSTLHLTLNRSASSTTSTAGVKDTFTPTRSQPRKGSVASSSSSTAVPLAESSTSADASRKRPRPSMADSELPPTATNRPIRAGKTIPRKQPPSRVSVTPPPTFSSAKGRGKAGAKKKLPPTPKSRAAVVSKTPDKKGKIKSSEIIEDSDEEAAAYDQEMGRAEEEDEFAMLLGASLAGGADEDAEGEEDEEEDEDEDEDDDADALGGAKVVLDGDGSEWL